MAIKFFGDNFGSKTLREIIFSYRGTAIEGGLNLIHKSIEVAGGSAYVDKPSNYNVSAFCSEVYFEITFYSEIQRFSYLHMEIDANGLSLQINQGVPLLEVGRKDYESDVVLSMIVDILVSTKSVVISHNGKLKTVYYTTRNGVERSLKYWHYSAIKGEGETERSITYPGLINPGS